MAERKLTQADLIAAANRIMAPYAIDVKEVVWWSVYEIGHRLTDRFDNVAPGEDRAPRVFTAGDACHTHSPKAGQGMNVPMQDTFNLGWKLAHALPGGTDADLLRSYSAERRTVARPLIETDHTWARIMSAPPGQSELDGGNAPRLVRAFKESLHVTGGLAVKYDASALIAAPLHQALATGQEIGRRFHSAPVVRLADAMRMQPGHVVEANGRWRIHVFAAVGDRGQEGGAIRGLADWLEHDAGSPVRRHTRADEIVDAVIDLRAIFQPRFDALDFGTMPSLLKPRTGKLGLMDFEKVFCTDHKGRGDVYGMRGIDRRQGCMVVVRPDQHVTHVLPLDPRVALSDVFAGVLRPVARR